MKLVPPSMVALAQRSVESDMPDVVTVYGPDANEKYTVVLVGPFNGRLQYRGADESDGTGNQFGSVDVASAWLYYPLSVTIPFGYLQVVAAGLRFSIRQNSRGQSKVNGVPFQQYLELQLVGPII